MYFYRWTVTLIVGTLKNFGHYVISRYQQSFEEKSKLRSFWRELDCEFFSEGGM